MNKAMINDMSMEQKLSTMEMLWDDLCKNSRYESPSWHNEVLGIRERQIQEGSDNPINWQQAKRNIRQQTE